MKLEPVGLPAALKAWRARDTEPLLTLHCGAPDCGGEVGAVFRTPKGPVVESRMHPLAEGDAEPDAGEKPTVPEGLADLGAGLGITGLADEFVGADGRGAWLEEPVRAQVDLLRSELYWQDPAPSCPQHGQVSLDQGALAEAVQEGRTRYDAAPR